MATEQSSQQSREPQSVPSILYGTAFKFDGTADLVKHALSCGYQGIDIAAVTRAYNEKLAGEALRSVVRSGSVRRDDVWVSPIASPHFLTSPQVVRAIELRCRI